MYDFLECLSLTLIGILSIGVIVAFGVLSGFTVQALLGWSVLNSILSACGIVFIPSTICYLFKRRH